MNSGIGTPFNRHEFEDLVYEIAEGPVKQEHVAKAGHIWHQIKELPSKEKDATIKLVQKTLTDLHSKLTSLKASNIDAKKEQTDVTQKIEVLRTMLFGTKLDALPSYHRFQVMMELANRFADRLSSHPEEQCTPIPLIINGKSYTAWKLEGHYILFGSADSMQGVTGFSDTLLHSNYHETLCISAINENAAFFMEDKKVFLVLHVDPKTVVHTQEQDLRSPRYKENTLQERTQWYDAARRMMAIGGEIDTAEQALRGILYHLEGFNPVESVPYTDLDRFNRISILIEEKLKDFPPNIQSLAALFLKFPDSPKVLAKFFDAVDRYQLIVKNAPALTRAADENTLTEILESLGIDNQGTISSILEKLTEDDLRALVTACSLWQHESTLSKETFEALREKIQGKWANPLIKEAMGAIEEVQKTKSRKTLFAALSAVERITNSQGITRLLSDEQNELFKELWTALHLEALLLINSSSTLDAWDMGKELGIRSPNESPQQFKIKVEGIIKANSPINSGRLDELITLVQKESISLSADVEGTLNQMIAEEKDASRIQALQSFKEDVLFIHDKTRYGMKAADKEEFESLLTEYTQMGYALKTELLKKQVIAALEETSGVSAPLERDLMVEILKGEQEPINDEATALRLARGVLIPGVDIKDISLLLQGKKIRQLIHPMEISANSHTLNRPQLKLNDLIRILTPLFSERDKTPYQKLFSSLEERLSQLENAEMTSSDEYQELLAAKNYLSKMLDPVQLFELLFPATAKDLDERLSQLDPSDPKFQMLSHARQNVVGKLQSLQKDLENIPPSVRGWDSDYNQPIDFLTAPDLLRSPQELVGQTSGVVSGEELINWNEINLDIEASGGGKAGGVYPTALVISAKLLANIDSLDLHGEGSLYNLGEIFEYAHAHSLPVFIRA